MATATLKTYHGSSMAETLSQVKNDLGSDAVILHTRSYKVGGVMGMGSKTMVEITATADAGHVKPRRLRPRRDIPQTTTPSPPATGHQRDVSRPVSNDAFVARPPWFEQRTRPEQTIARAPNRDTTRSTPTAGSIDESAARGKKPSTAQVQADEGTDASPAPLMPSQTSSPSVLSSRRGEEQAHQENHNRSAVDTQEKSGGVSRLSAGVVAPSPTNARASQALEEELVAIRKLVGQVLQSTRRVEVRTAAADDLASDSTLANRGPLFELYLQLLDHQVSTPVADQLAGEVRDELSAEDLNDATVVRQAMLEKIAGLIKVDATTDISTGAREHGRPATGPAKVIALLGPTGVGKTTTVAKLAANHKLRYGQKVGLITADTYRIAAVEQLRTYADIVGLPMKVALTPNDMRDAIESLRNCDLVLVDTAGRSQHDAGKLDELRAFLQAASPDEQHLVLSIASSESVIVRAAERFGALGPARVILSKLDEAEDFGVIANIASRIGLPVSHVTTGQEVPDHIEPAQSMKLAKLVLDGVSSWPVLRRSNNN